MSVKLFGKDLKQYTDLSDLDELLAKLTPEELDELNTDLDPDNSLLPPSERVKDQTTKKPSGAYDREKLLAFLEKKGREEKDWEQNKSYVKETKGKVWKRKEQPKPEVEDEFSDMLETEWDDVLNNATEEELVDLAAVLGFHGMLNQVQYHASLEDRKVDAGGFRGVAKTAALKLTPKEPPNPTDVQEAVEKIQSNDAKLIDLNLNNIKNISIERLVIFAEALADNTNLVSLNMANVRMTDKVVQAMAKSLKTNKTLKTLNFESNFIGGEAIVELVGAINVNQTVTEIKLENQRSTVLGVKVEMKLTQLIEENETLIKFGLGLQIDDARVRTQKHIQRNYDKYRQKRKTKGTSNASSD